MLTALAACMNSLLLPEAKKRGRMREDAMMIERAKSEDTVRVPDSPEKTIFEYAVNRPRLVLLGTACDTVRLSIRWTPF